MRFTFDKAACQNIRRASRKEWLLTNGLGDYASSSILGCNTRKYHGLLTVNTPNGRHVLLSALEESVKGGGKEFFLSTRRHPQTLYPRGHEYLESFRLDQWPEFVYRVGDVRVCREVLLVQNTSLLLMRWSIKGTPGLPPLTLRLRPLLAYRHFHTLTHANDAADGHIQPEVNGFSVAPYHDLPRLFFRSDNAFIVNESPDWCRNVEYIIEQERGFPFSEDLFSPGTLEIPLTEEAKVYLAVGTAPVDVAPEKLWRVESRARTKAHKAGGGLLGHLAQVGKDFCIETPSKKPAVLAGYHWFDAWGRDTLIALPGLTFYAGRTDFGLRVLRQVADNMQNGLVPNCFTEDDNHAYNSADASLWYAFAVQCYLQENPDGLAWVREHAWPALKSIIQGYRQGPGMGIYIDNEGLLHAGDTHTQLTWMDAKADGMPVTPRHGCPVELNALWYNTLAFVDHLSAKFDEPDWNCTTALRHFRTTFVERFWSARGNGYLGDVYHDGMLDQSVRPNQILAVSLPYPVLAENWFAPVVECVRNKLLTPYGLRTLSPDDPAFKGRYEGGPSSRDGAYHQGTIWPWLLGHYTDALLRAAWDVRGAASALLTTLTPLYSDHLTDAGLGGISEIFSATPPYTPDGCIHQAWSIAESLRLLTRLQREVPDVYERWQQGIVHRLAHPVSGDTAGVCRATMTINAV